MNILDISVLFVFVIVFLFVFLIGVLINRASIVNQIKYLNIEASKIQSELNNSKRNEATLQERSDTFHAIVERQDSQIKELMSEISRLEKSKSVLETKEENLISKEKSFKIEFSNLARQILEDNTKKISEDSKVKLDQVLSPFRDKLNALHNKVETIYVEEAKERYSLKQEIEKLARTHENLHSQAENLTRALKGDNKTQGNWGEIQLINILGNSGLKENQDYIIQAKGLGLFDDQGSRQQPDVIVNLPDNKHLIIDVKVNLVSYERYINAEDINEKSDHLKKFIDSIKEQIKNLSSKSYQLNDKLSSPDFVFMFMPIESAYTLAILEDGSLHNFAWDRRIILASPSVLFAMLKTVAYGLSTEKKNKNIEDILKRSSEMYDKFVGFLEDMDKIGLHLDKVQESYESAINKLSSGKGNLISKAERMRELGLTPKKNIPDRFFVDEDSIDQLNLLEKDS